MPNLLSRHRGTGRLAGAFASAAISLVLALVVACTDPQEQPARESIAKIDAALAATGNGPAKYIPGQLKEAQAHVDALKREYSEENFAAVVEAAPGVLAEVKALAPTAEARARELEATLQTEWSGLVEDVPREVDAMRTALAAASSGRRPAGLTDELLANARRSEASAQALWQRALQEQAAGRLPEAVTLANQVQALCRQVMALPGVGAPEPAVK